MIDIQNLFDGTLDELEKRVDTNDEYEILMVSPLLRKILIDGDNSLICQLNKKGRKLRFNVNVREPLHIRVPSIFTNEDLKTYSWLALDGFNPDTADKGRDYSPQSLSLDDFLKQIVIYTKSMEISVRDLIKHVSDKEGGVHRQRKDLREDEVKNILLADLGDLIGFNNLSAGLVTLRTIGIVVARDLSCFRT
jgi:hypothetical protein